jgi:hypothetical protein
MAKFSTQKLEIVEEKKNYSKKGIVANYDDTFNFRPIEQISLAKLKYRILNRSKRNDLILKQDKMTYGTISFLKKNCIKWKNIFKL